MRFGLNLSIFEVGKRLLLLQTRSLSTEVNLHQGTPFPIRTELDNYLRKLKLRRFQSFQEKTIHQPCLEVLKTAYEDLDIVHVRKRQPQLLYVRIELLLQRLNYLKPIRLPARQKRRLIERNPPVLLLDFDSERPKGKQVGHLRGVVKGENVTTHIIHPCTPLIVMRSFDLNNKVKFIQEELGMAQQSVLRLILNTPTFFIHHLSEMPEKCIFMHKYKLPRGFHMDTSTAEMYPLVYQRNEHLNPLIHTKVASENMACGLPTLSLSDVLDYSYKDHHGKGQPEDLNQFLKFADSRELRPRYNTIM